MGSIMQFGMALGLAGSAGVRAYFPLIVVGLIARFSETMSAKPPLTIISSLPVLLLLIFLAAIELMPELTTGIENSMVLPFIRGLSGGLLFPGVFSGFGLFFGFVFGAVVAILAHMVLVRLRPAFNQSLSPQRSSGRANAVEELIPIMGTLLALLLPWTWYFIWGMIIVHLLKKAKGSQGRFRSQGKPKSWR